MNMKKRLEKLEHENANRGKGDEHIIALLRGREANLFGDPQPDVPTPPEWEHSPNALRRAIFAARKRTRMA